MNFHFQSDASYHNHLNSKKHKKTEELAPNVFVNINTTYPTNKDSSTGNNTAAEDDDLNAEKVYIYICIYSRLNNLKARSNITSNIFISGYSD